MFSLPTPAPSHRSVDPWAIPWDDSASATPGARCKHALVAGTPPVTEKMLLRKSLLWDFLLDP